MFIHSQGKLNRKSINPKLCYICSRLEATGKYKTKHGGIFNERGLISCEHHPRTPYPTLVEDENHKIIERQSSNPDWNFGVSVTFKNRLTPDKTVKKFFSASLVKSEVDENGNIKDPSKYHLPPVLGDKFDKVRFSEEVKKFLPVVGEKTLAEAGPLTIEISHSGLHRTVALQISDDEDEYDDAGLPRGDVGTSTFIEAEQPIMPRQNQKFLPVISQRRDNLVSFGIVHDEEGDPHRVIINDLDGGGGNDRKRSRRWIVSDGEPARSKFRTGRNKDGLNGLNKRNNYNNYNNKNMKIKGKDSQQAKDGRLKYNHRDENSSLPHNSQDLSLDGTKILTDGTFESIDSSALDRTPSMIIQKITEMEHWCQCADVDLNTLKCPNCGIVGGHEDDCTFVRSNSRQGICPKCRKPVKKQTIALAKSKVTTKSRERRPSITTTMSEDVNLLRRGTTTSLKSTGKDRHVRFDDTREGTPYTTQSMDDMRGRSISRSDYEDDDDYMDYNDLAVDNDGNVWTAMSKKSSLSRAGKDREARKGGLPKPHPWPTFDPNIHRDAYIKALTARSLEKLKKYEELDDKLFRERLVKPNVFSYFKLRPFQKNSQPDGPDDIGIRPPPKMKPIPNKKAMPHIFGKLKVSDFYPGGKFDDSGVPKIETKKKSRKKKKD